MPTSRGTQDRQTARGAVLALHHAVCSLRQHPGNDELLRAALRRCTDALHAATGRGTLTIALGDGVVQVADEPVVPYGPTDPPFGPLHRAGIGELHLQPGMPAQEVEALVRRLAGITHDEDPERAIRGLVGAPALAHVRLRASACGSDANAEVPADWSLLPVRATAPDLQAFVARDLASNLPALAARQILDDVDAGPHDASDCLPALFARMLAAGDLASASWLLAEVDHHPGLAPATREQLHRQATERAGPGWLRQQLELGTRSEWMDLTAFVMQVGGEVATNFARLLQELAHPLAHWFADLPGTPRQ